MEFKGSSFIIKKLGLLRLRDSSSTSAADGGFGYLRDWVWWTGLITSKVFYEICFEINNFQLSVYFNLSGSR